MKKNLHDQCTMLGSNSRRWIVSEESPFSKQDFKNILSSYGSRLGKVAVILIFLFTSVSNLHSQYCLASTSNVLITPGATSQTTAVYNNGVRAFRFAATAGCTYTFSTCGLSTADTYLRLYSTGTGGTLLVSADDNCGAQSSFTWTCATAGTYSVLLTNYSCVALNSNTSMSYIRNSCAPPQNMVPATGNNAYTLCSGVLYDHGGSAGNYNTNVSGYTVLNPATAGNLVQVSGTTAGETCCDFLRIYDGTGITGTLLWSGFAGAGTVPTVTSTTGPLTVQFTSDVSVVGAGFALNIACIAPCVPPAVVGFGVNTWNVLGYQHAAYNYANLATLTGETFKGYYTDATVDINSELRWGATLSPSSATAYTGCPITVDNHTVVYKRQGFPSAFYQIDLNTHDDGVQCYVNGTLVYQIDGCCADRGVIWSGRLCSTSTVEFRVMEGGGGSNLNVDFIDVPFTAGTISGTSSICPGGSSNLTTTGNPGGTWSSSNSAIASVNASGVVSAVSSGNATITYTVNGGTCGNATATYAVTIVAGASAGLLSGTQTVCAGSTTTFTSSGNAGGTWSSDNTGVATVNASSGVITAVGAGSATITYTVLGSGGCPNATATRTVTVIATPTSNAGTDATLCPSQTTVLNGSSNMSDSYVYTLNMSDSYGDGWNGGYLTAFINGTASGNYSAGGFGTTATINILPGQTLYFTYTSGAWEGENSYSIALNGATVYSTGANPATGTVYTNNSHPQTVTYAWTPSTALSSSTILTPTCSAATTTTYTLTVTSNGCSSSDQVVVTVLPGSSAGILSGTQTVCAGSTTTFTSSGNAGGTWSSDNTGVATVNTSSGVITGVGAGSATITYTVLGSGGCPNATATRAVTVSVAPTSNSGADVTLCPSQTTVLNGSSNMSDSYVYTLNMSDSYGDGWNGGYLTAFINGTASGNYSAGGFGTTATINILPGQTLYFTYTSGAWEVENSYSIALNGATVYSTGANPATGTVYTNNSHPQTVTYAWTPSTALSSSTILTPTCSAATTTTYTLTVTSNGCSSSDQVVVTVLPGSSAGILSGTQTACIGATTTFTSNGAAGGTWSSNNAGVASVNTSTGVITGAAAGSATITYTVLGSGGCPDATATRIVTVNAAPIVNAGPDVNICASEAITLNATVTASNITTGSLSTTFAGGNGCGGGNMFDVVTAAQAVTINGFTITPMSTSLQTVNVYYKTGTYAGSTTNSGAWTLLGSYTVNGTAATQIYMATGNIAIPANTTYGIYVQYDAQYTDGTNSYTNGVITVNTGQGHCAAFDGCCSPRTFNGIIHYAVSSGSTPVIVWSPSSGLSSTTILNPTANPTSTANYTITATIDGCPASDAVQVTVNNPTLATAPTNGDMVWKGAATTDWATLGNWWQYNGTSYGAATAAPTDLQNVIIPAIQSCVSNQPNTFTNGGSAKSLRIESGATLTMGNGTLSIAENMVNNGTFAPGSGTVAFTGTGNHSISGSSLAHNFNNVTMNKNGEVILSVPIIIAGSLTLTDGRLNIGNFNLDLPTNTINGGNASSYVKTSGTGTLSRDVAGIAVNFPVGRSAYNAATLTNAGTADKYSVRVIDNVTDIGTNADAGATTTMAVVNRTWMINEQVAGGSDVTLGLNWNGAPEHIGGFQPPSAFIAHYMSGAGLWDNIGGAVATNTIETSGITSFSPFTISSDLNFAPLPVELMSFSSVCSDNDVAIKWSTASENNSMHFVVETSTDALYWEVLSVVPAAQFSTSILNYAITHEGAARNKNYYRLKQVDLDGAVEFFNVIYANCGDVAGEPVVFPNPSNGNFTIDFSGAEMKGVVQLSIMNTEGKEISNREVNLEEGVNTYQINNMELQPGIYYLKIVDTTGRSFIIKHSFI